MKIQQIEMNSFSEELLDLYRVAAMQNDKMVKCTLNQRESSGFATKLYHLFCKDFKNIHKYRSS